MKTLAATLALPLFACFSTLAQAGQGPPTPTPPDDSDVVRISTKIVQVDVSVTNKDGSPVSDLRPDEVEIFENGKERKITNFSFVAGDHSNPVRDKAARTAAAKRPLLPGSPVRLESVRRIVAIVLDDLNLSIASAYWATNALKKFIREEIQEGDLVAIMRTRGGSGAMQQFTTDRRHLLAALDRPVYRFGRASFIEPIRDVGGVANPKQKEIDDLRDRIFGTGTLGSLNLIVRGMRDLPGRKSVVLITDNIRIYDRDSNGTPNFSLDYYAVRRLIDFANRSSVSFYPIHAPGLIVPMVNAEDDVRDISLPGGVTATDGIIRGRQQFLNDAQDGLRFLAENTGGFASINSNSITKGLRRVMDDQSYYLLAYDPDEDTFDRRTRGPFDPQSLRYTKHEVKVNRPGVRVRFRSGFIGASDDEGIRPRSSSVAEQILTAITSPFTSSQIDVSMNSLFLSDNQKKASVVSFVNVDPAQLSFTDAGNGLKKTSFDLVAFTFGAEGNVVDERAKNFTVTVTEPQLAALQKRGLIATFGLPVKKSGGYQVRLAVRDPSTGRLGTATQFIEIPQVDRGKFALSGALLSSGDQAGVSAKDAVSIGAEDPMRYTSVRRFRPGMPLQFSLFAYNPKLDRQKKINLIQSYRLYKDNAVIFTSEERTVSTENQPSLQSIAISGGLMLGAELLPGDYVIEVMVKDQNDKGRVATQFIQFEIVS